LDLDKEAVEEEIFRRCLSSRTLETKFGLLRPGTPIQIYQNQRIKELTPRQCLDGKSYF
jgi:hypothetical protein